MRYTSWPTMWSTGERARYMSRRCLGLKRIEFLARPKWSERAKASKMAEEDMASGDGL